MSLDGQGRALVGTFAMPAGTVFPHHTHDRHQLVWAAEGVVNTAVGDRQWVLPSNRALWVPAGVRHATWATGAAVLRSVYVDPARASVRWPDPTPVEATVLVGELVNRLSDEGLHGAAQRRTEAVLLDLLVPVEVAAVGPPLPKDPRARDVAVALLEGPADSRSLAAWGAHVGASARTLARAFDRTGMSFGRWRSEARMQVALRLLADGEAVVRVAAKVGYASPSAFVAAFRARTGVTPGSYFSGSHASRSSRSSSS